MQRNTKLTRQTVISAIRAMGLTCNWKPATNEYRVNLIKADGGTEGTSYYTNDGQDAIDTARMMAQSRPKTNQMLTQEWIDALRSMLSSSKFTGFEIMCTGCGQLCGTFECVGIGFPVSDCCRAAIRQERKDWISVGDVLRQLDALEASWR